MLALEGGTFQFSVRVPLPVTGDPETLKSDAGAASPTLVTVPLAPGKVCPLAKVMIPLPAIARLPIATCVPLSVISELVRCRGFVSNLASVPGVPDALKRS